MEKEIYQELQLRFKIVCDTVVSERTFAWRRMNFKRLWLTDLTFYVGNEFSFRTEFNAKFSREEIEKIINEETYFYTGDGISTKSFKAELIELLEEKDIYGNE